MFQCWCRRTFCWFCCGQDVVDFVGCESEKVYQLALFRESGSYFSKNVALNLFREFECCFSSLQFVSSITVLFPSGSIVHIKMQSGLRSMESNHKTIVILRCKLILVGKLARDVFVVLNANNFPYYIELSVLIVILRLNANYAYCYFRRCLRWEDSLDTEFC